MAGTDYERRKAVAGAWKNEKHRVIEGRGTRNWTQPQQREIILTGKAQGFEGHHMKSVAQHNSLAGDPNNIQFLTRKEHFAAHNGDFHNQTNGCYNPNTGVTKSFGRGKPSIEAKALNNPLGKTEVQGLCRRAEANRKIEAAKQKAKRLEKRQVNKTKLKNPNEAQSKTLAKQHSSDKRREVPAKNNSKTLSQQKSEGTHKVSPSTSKKKTRPH